MSPLFSLLLAVTAYFGAFSLPCHAQETDQPTSGAMAPEGAKAPAKPVYLTGEEKAWNTFPKAPAIGSDVDQLDLQTILSLQASRTEEQKTEAVAYKHYQDALTALTDVIDPAFKTKYPNIYVVITQADKDGAYITTMLKNQNARLRPYQQHPAEVKPLYTTPGKSYPSGHASGSELQARLLATLFHANGQDALLLKRAQQIAQSRVIAGVHNPSDVKAGADLGDLIFTELEANAKFTAALAAAAKTDSVATP